MHRTLLSRRSVQVRERYRRTPPTTRCPHARAPARGRGWPQARTAAESGQKEKTVATVQTRDRVVAGIGPTTSSLRHLLTKLGARTRRQAEDADEARRVLLVVAVAHGERREVGAIEGVLRFAAGDGDVPLIERERNRARDVLLCAFD